MLARPFYRLLVPQQLVYCTRLKITKASMLSRTMLCPSEGIALANFGGLRRKNVFRQT